MTLSHFLRDYLYIALGGNRKGKYRRYANLFITMLLGGLWHGAGWPFVVWGGLHGGYLMVNHGWRYVMERLKWNFSQLLGYKFFCCFVTFIAVVFAWVYFRAHTLEQGNQIALAMLGLSGFEIPAGILARTGEVGDRFSAMGFVPVLAGGYLIVTNYIWIIFSAVIAFTLPNVSQVFHKYDPVLYENDNAFRNIRQSSLMGWDLNNRWAFAIAVAGLAGVLTLQQVSEFLYFQF